MTRARRFAAAAALATLATLGLGAPASAAPATALSADGHDEHHSVVDVSENNVGPIQACNNNVSTNVLGVQVPVSDVAAILGFDQQGNAAANTKVCTQESAQDN